MSTTFSARLVDVVLVFMAVEFVVLCWRRHWRPESALTIALALAPGACFAVALRAAIGGAGWPVIAACLAAALPCHLADLWRRRL